MKSSALHRSKTPSEKAVLKTLLYSDIFNFPLTKEEIWRFIISKKPLTKTTFENAVQSLRMHSHLTYREGLYCLKGKKNIISQRLRNLSEVEHKKQLAQKVASLLAYIPTILFIGISGSVAIGNVKKADDIDFFIITKRNTLFVTRLWILVLLELRNLRRKWNDREAENKICANLLIDETQMRWSRKKRDLYTAHEIIQIIPLFERDNCYTKFFQANKWITQFCPHAAPQAVVGEEWQRNYVSLSFISLLFTAPLIEALVRILQKKIMKRHRTNEVIKNTILAFHPVDYREQTLATFERNLSE